MEIEEEFLIRTTDRSNRLIANVMLYANLTCVIFLVARNFKLFSMSYEFTLMCWGISFVFSLLMNIFVRFNVNRTVTMYLGLIGVVTLTAIMGSNSRIGIHITYAFATLFSCLYLQKKYTIVAASMGYTGLVISIFIKSQSMYLLDLTSDTPRDYFIPAVAGYTIEYILLIITCLSITKILRKTVLDLQERNKRIRNLQFQELQTFANLVESRDNFSGQHIKRTSKYVEILCNELSKTEKYKAILTDEVINRIVEAAPLHDLGKIQIPDDILKKPGKLTPEEYETMKTHSEIGYNMINAYLPEIIDEELLMYSEMMALYHHEHFDGTGYPRGLEGNQIPLCARIMTVADVLDALLSKRHYKDSFSLEEALDIMRNETGKTFDPDIIECLMKVIPLIRNVNSQNEPLDNGEELEEMAEA